MKFITLVIGLTLTSCNFVLVKKQTVEDLLQWSREYGYYNGQVDAINCDIRIIKGNSTYIWMRSPWDSGVAPIYNPLATIEENIDYITKTN